MISDSSDTLFLLDQAGGGDPHALGELLVRHKERLTRIVSFRMDRRLQGRIDAADVVQEAFIDATRRFPDFAEERAVPFFLWLRYLVVQKLAELHRHHLGVKARDVGREVSIYKGPLPQATSAVLAAQLLGKQTSPSQAAARAELRMQLEEKLNALDEIDREVLALRHFEQLSNTEAAAVLQISESAASNRYVRAVKRLKAILGPGSSVNQ